MRGHEEIISKLNSFIDGSPLNRVESMRIERVYDYPLVGFAAANDPMFDRLKEPDVISPRHMSPGEWLPGAETVISYFLPFTQQIRKANHQSGLPAMEWLYGRIEGEQFNNALRRVLVDEIVNSGGKAVSPVLDFRFSVIDRRSNWSERHAAFIAGLGTFSLGKSLITQKGCAGRCGSVITDLKLEPTPREYNDVYEYCTWCGECIGRCPAGAINEQGKDIPVCSRYIDEIELRFRPRYGCGKCQTAVPCECSRP